MYQKQLQNLQENNLSESDSQVDKVTNEASENNEDKELYYKEINYHKYDIALIQKQHFTSTIDKPMNKEITKEISLSSTNNQQINEIFKDTKNQNQRKVIKINQQNYKQVNQTLKKSSQEPKIAQYEKTKKSLQFDNSNLIDKKQEILLQESKIKENFVQQFEKKNIEKFQITQTVEQKINKFDCICKGKTILLQQNQQVAIQNQLYYKNQKIVLTQPIRSLKATAIFRIDELKYCVGVGIALKQVIEKHSFNYQSNANQMSHGLYIVTSQGYSWSHSEPQDDDIFRQGFNMLYTGSIIKVFLEGSNLIFKCKKNQFSIQIPNIIRRKYQLCFCAYIHEKNDSISLCNY